MFTTFEIIKKNSVFCALLLCSIASMASPPQKCLLRREAWCLGEGPSKVILDLQGGTAQWRVYAGLNEDRFFEITEESECNDREPLSVTTVNARIEKINARDGYAILRLQIRSKCMFRVKLPIGSHDPDKEVFFFVFAAIRPCSPKGCESNILISQRDRLLDEIDGFTSRSLGTK